MKRALTLLASLLFVAPGFAMFPGHGPNKGALTPPVAGVGGCGVGVVVDDEFDEPGASDINLNTGTPDTGGPWTGTAAGSGILVIDTTNDEVKSTSGSGTAVISDTLSCNDYIITGTGKTGSTGSNRVRLAARYDEVASNGYDGGITGGGAWEIREIVSGTATILSSGTIGGFSASTYYDVSFAVSGSLLSLSIGGVLQGSITGGTYTTGTAGFTISGTAPRLTAIEVSY